MCFGQMACLQGWTGFTGEQLKETADFGKNALLKSGKNVSTKEFANWRQK